MERGVNYIIIGGCFIASLIGLVVFIFWFSGDNVFSNNFRIYKAYSKNAIEEVRIDSFVKYKGINIGRIQDIRFRDENFDEVEILLSLRSDLPIKKGSILRISQSGIIGNSFLTLIQNEKSDEYIESSDEAVLFIEPETAIGKILDSVPNLTNKVDDLLSNANTILSKENAKNIASILSSIEDSAISLNKMLKSLQHNTTDIDSILSNIDNSIKKTNDTIEIVNNKLQNGEYDLKSTLTPALLSIEQSLYNINELAKKGSNLLDNLEQNPYNTIFGYRQEGENDK